MTLHHLTSTLSRARLRIVQAQRRRVVHDLSVSCSSPSGQCVGTSRTRNLTRHAPARARVPGQTRSSSSSSSQSQSESPLPPPPPPSAHSQWYRDIVPAMIPIALIGSAIYLALQLAQTTLSTSKHLSEANARIQALESRLEVLQAQAQAQAQAAREADNANAPSASIPPVVDNQKSSRWWFAGA